jgi:hypothetical protein
MSLASPSTTIIHSESFLNRSQIVPEEFVMQPPLTIRTLGTPALWIGPEPIHERLPEKALALLIYLACTREIYSREVLAEFFWEGRTQTQALTNLRKVIGQLQSTVGPYVASYADCVSMSSRTPITGWM